MISLRISKIRHRYLEHCD